MAAHYWINQGGWVEITDRVNLREPQPLMERAEEGSVGMSTLVIDDPLADLEIDPFTLFLATEDTSESDDQIWAAGFLYGRTVVRNASGFNDPLGRFWSCEFVDTNERWHRRVLKGAEANRDEESDNARAHWVLQQMQDWGLVDDDTTYVTSGAASGDLDAEDMRGRYPDDVLGQASEAKSKNWWLQRQGELGDITDVAWWGSDGLSGYTSPLFLTNDQAIIATRLEVIRVGESDVWPLRMDHGLRCSPERMYSGTYARHRSGTIYRRDAGTVAVIGVRDVVMADTEQLTKAKAISRATRYLDEFDEEDFRVDARVRLPASKVTQLRAGMRVAVAMTHWPFGLDEWTWWRVMSVAVSPAAAGPWYDLELDLSSTGEAAGAPGDGPAYAGDAISSLVAFGASGNAAVLTNGFSYTGDSAGSGYATLATVGPLTPTSGSGDPSPAKIVATDDIVVRISARCWANGVWTVTAVGASLNVSVNGVIIASDVQDLSGSGFVRFEVDVGDVVLAPGDIVTMDTNPGSPDWLGGYGDYPALKWSSFLVVGRGTHTLPQDAADLNPWTGP